MSVQITIRPLPHAVAYDAITSAELKKTTMLIMEDIQSMKRQLEESQKAIIELQGRRG